MAGSHTHPRPTTTVRIHSPDRANDGVVDSGLATVSITVDAVNDAPSFTKGPNQTANEVQVRDTVSPWATGISSGSAGRGWAGRPTSSARLTPTRRCSRWTCGQPIGRPDLRAGAERQTGLRDVRSRSMTTAARCTAATTRAHADAQDHREPGQRPAGTCANDGDATFVGTALNALLGSCTDIDGDTLTFAGGLTSPSHGTVTIHPNSTYTRTRRPGPSRAPTRSHSRRTTAQAALERSHDDHPRLARSDRPERRRPDRLPARSSRAVGRPRSRSSPTTWTSRAGPLSIIAVTQGAKGKVAITGGGTALTYDPTALATGSDSFRYTIQDNQMRTNSAIVVMIISPDKTQADHDDPHRGCRRAEPARVDDGEDPRPLDGHGPRDRRQDDPAPGELQRRTVPDGYPLERPSRRARPGPSPSASAARIAFRAIDTVGNVGVLGHGGLVPSDPDTGDVVREIACAGPSGDVARHLRLRRRR